MVRYSLKGGWELGPRWNGEMSRDGIEIEGIADAGKTGGS